MTNPFFSFSFRLEYEQNRDMDSPIKELETSLSALGNNLKQLQKRETEAKLAAEKAIGEINRWKDEVQGVVLLILMPVQYYDNLVLPSLVGATF